MLPYKQPEGKSQSSVIEGSLEVKLPTIWTDGRAELGRIRQEKRKKRRSEKRKSEKKEDAGARKGRKVAIHCVFPMVCGSAGSKSRLAKAVGAEPSGQMRDEKLYAVVARSAFPSQNIKNTTCSDHARDSAPCQKWENSFVVFPKTMASMGHLKRISRGKRSTKDMFIRDVRRLRRWFPEKGCILEHQIFRFAEMILRDRCSTPYDLASLFRGRRGTLDRWSGKIAKRIGRRPSALHSTFHYWRKPRRIASFLMLPTSNIEEALQDCFVFRIADRQTNKQIDR